MDKEQYKNQDDRYFRLTSFYVAAFLFAKGMELVNIDRTDPKRSQFVFRDSPERDVLIQNFNYAPEGSTEALVDARKFVMAIKMLKDKLYQEGM